MNFMNDWSCVNTKREPFNRKLGKIMKNYQNEQFWKQILRENALVDMLCMSIVCKEVSAQPAAANSITLFQGKKEDLISLCWNDKYDEIDNNVICSNTNINDDQQNMTCQDENTIRMSKRHKKPPVKKEWWLFMVKNHHIGNTLIVARIMGQFCVSGSLSPRHGASSGCG